MASGSQTEAVDSRPEDLRLESILDAVSIEALVEDFHELTGHVMSLVDLDGHSLVRVGWHDACTRFHRMSPEACELCRSSDTDMTEGVARGETRAYRCKNGLWHVVTPLFVGKRHLGNAFTSQFFFDDEEIDVAAFERQAERFGFDRGEYLTAIRALPRYSHAKVDLLMRFYVQLAEQISMLGLANLELAETMSARESALAARIESESLLVKSQRIARVGHYNFNMVSDFWDCSEVLGDIFGIDDSYVRDLAGWLGIVHADDRAMMEKYVGEEVVGAGHPFDKEYRITRVVNGETRWVHGLGDVTRDEDGNPQTLFGIIQDVTDRRAADAAVAESAGRLERMVYDVAEAMGRVVEARDPYTQGHQQRVAGLAKRIAVRMGLSQCKIDEVEMAGLLHDVGKLRIPTEILTKPGRLSPNEFALVMGHSEQGYEILKDIAFPWDVAEIARQHHERMDGSGYPRGLSDGEIVPAARILAVADVVEAMASHRPYRPTLGIDAAIAEIVSHPEKFDAEVTRACVALHVEGQLGL
jgi:putative nucleotidyltransferase with HDIG domain/PAS domain S-box-containing protein